MRDGLQSRSAIAAARGQRRAIKKDRYYAIWYLPICLLNNLDSMEMNKSNTTVGSVGIFSPQTNLANNEQILISYTPFCGIVQQQLNGKTR